MRALPFVVSLWLGWAVLGTPVLHAQDQQDQEEEAAPPAANSAPPPAYPSVDLTDLWRKWRHKDEPTEKPDRRFLVLAPSIGSRPNTGLTLGVNGNVAFFRGDSESTHLSSMSGGVRVSQKKQVL